MNIRANWLVVSAVALCLGACQKKEEVKTPAVAPATGQAPSVVAPPAAPTSVVPPAAPTSVLPPAALSLEERSAKLGFVQYLPQDTEVVMAFHNGLKSSQRMRASKLWKLVQAETGMGGEPDADKTATNEPELPTDGAEAKPDAPAATTGTAPGAAEDSGPAALFGTEFTIALGKTLGEQSANLFTGYRRMNYFQMRALAKGFAAAAKSGDFSGLEAGMAEQYGPALFKDLLADPESGVGLIDRLKMPPLYLAFRTTVAARPAAAQQLAALVANLALLGEVVEPAEAEAAGQKFTGHKLSGKKISTMMQEEQRADMESVLDPATVDRLLAAIGNKDLVALSGTLGDYAILFIGSSADDLKLTATPAQSMVATTSLAFCDAYSTKDLAAVIYGQKDSMDKLIASTGGLSDMATGLRDGLSGSDGLGDTRDLEALLRMVGEREAALRKLISNETLGLAAFFEDGFKIETFGGSDNGALDWKATNQLGALGDSDDVVMFSNMTKDAAHDAKVRAYIEAIMETAYAMAMKATELKMDVSQIDQFKGMAKIFDTKFRTDAVALWDSYNGDFADSLGNERACVVDLKGAVPAIPGIPQSVVDQGKFPRISLVAPVKDRSKLAASWQKMNASTTNILASISEITGQKIPMQKPISSEKDGFTTWFFSLPFFSDDFMPSVTVGDQWFVASTSKNQALDLLNKAAKGGSSSTGACLTVNFKTLQKFSNESLKLLDQNAKAIFSENAAAADKMKQAAKFILAMDDLDKLNVHARREAGVLRASIHLKTR